MSKKILLITALAFALAANSAFAKEDNEPQAGLVPGNPLYILDVASEGIGTMFTFGDVAKAERYLTLASERLAEVRELVENDKEDLVGDTLKRYEEKLEAAMARAKAAKDNGEDTTELLQKISDATSKHLEVLSGVLEKVPEQAREAIQNAMERSQNGHDTALQVVGGEKKDGENDENVPANGGSRATTTGETNAAGAGKPEGAGRSY
jgi:hypothetical protein